MPIRPSPLLRIGSTAAVTAALMSGCVPAPQPAPPPVPVATRAPPPAPRPTSAPMPVPAPTTWLDMPRTPGDWRYQATAEGSAAFYGDAGGAIFSVLCHRSDRTIELVRPGAITAPASMVVRTTIRDGAIAAQPGTAGATATLAAGDAILDTMAFSRGRFSIEVAGLPSVYLPAWPELARTIEDCR